MTWFYLLRKERLEVIIKRSPLIKIGNVTFHQEFPTLPGDARALRHDHANLLRGLRDAAAISQV